MEGEGGGEGRGKKEESRSFGGFDPGSGLTLAACLSHASRAGRGKPLSAADGGVIHR